MKDFRRAIEFIARRYDDSFFQLTQTCCFTISSSANGFKFIHGASCLSVPTTVQSHKQKYE